MAGNGKSESLATEEWKLLQGIIRGQEETRLKLRNWGITLLAALAVAGLSAELTIGPLEYLVLSVAIIVLFWTLEATYHQAEIRAMDRNAEVEMALRGEQPYDGPRIGVSLQHPMKEPRRARRLLHLGYEILGSIRYLRLAAAYVGLLVLVMVVSTTISATN